MTLRLLSSCLLFASSLSLAAAQDYTIAGRVINAETGSPLQGAQVAISPSSEDPVVDQASPPQTRNRQRSLPSQSSALSVLSGLDGSFRFDHLPAGRYSLSGTRRGYITSRYQEHGLYSSAVVTGNGLVSEGLILRLDPGAVITGAVTDNFGDPVEQASVSLYRLQDDGLGSIRSNRSVQTNDLGAYEFTHLSPGTYFVSASGRPWYAVAAQSPGELPPESNLQSGDQVPGARPTPASSTNLDVVYPRAYYADATDSANATPIPIHGGEQVRANLHMNAVPAVHLTVQMQAPNAGENASPESPMQGAHFGGPGFQVPRLVEPVFGEMDGAASTSGRVSFEGESDHQTITMSVAPGQYQLEDGGYTLPVNATSDAHLDAHTGIPPTQVTGRVALSGSGDLPHSLSLGLVLANGHTNAGFPAEEHNGNQVFEAVPPGEYELSALGDGQKLAVVQIAAQGATLDGHVLRIGTQPVTFAATLAPSASVLSGFTEENGRPASGVMVVLVPEHPSDHSLYRRDQSDSDGSFTMREIAAGNYTLVAIRDGWDLDWARPEVISHYLPAGLPITITGSATPTVHPTKPVQVQPR